jgi:hypothetical protein
MREIDNNLTNVNFKNIQPIAPAEDSTNSPKNETAAPAEKKEIKDLKNMPAAELGKSQVASDSIETDMKFLEKHPELVKELNQAIDNYAKDHTEEETLKLIEKTHQEFVTK